MRTFLLPLALLLAAPAAAQEWRMAPEYDVQLSTYDIQPPEIRLKAGEPVRLRFVNNSNQGLTFSAGDFFRSSKLRRRDSNVVKGGSVRVPPLSTRTVVLVPRPGRYRAQGANFLHRLLGMSGRIIVE
jgi:plastocyanin